MSPPVPLPHGGPAPSVSFADGQLWHLGTLDTADKGRHSFEGAGISVSTHPTEWCRIARLGGASWWRFSRPRNCFVDRWSLTDVDELSLTEWGWREGLVSWVDRWEVTLFDDELDSLVISHHTSYREALAETDGDPGPIRVVPGLAAAGRLAQLQGATEGATLSTFDLLLAEWATRQPALDGVWWDDEVGPYSAPRGVIAVSRLTAWTTECVRPAGQPPSR